MKLCLCILYSILKPNLLEIYDRQIFHNASPELLNFCFQHVHMINTPSVAVLFYKHLWFLTCLTIFINRAAQTNDLISGLCYYMLLRDLTPLPLPCDAPNSKQTKLGHPFLSKVQFNQTGQAPLITDQQSIIYFKMWDIDFSSFQWLVFTKFCS